MMTTHNANSAPIYRACPAAFCLIILLAMATARPAPPTPAKPTTAATTDDATAIKEAAKRMYIWATVPNYLAPDEVIYATDDESRKWLAPQSEYARAEHRLAEVVRQKLGERALAPLQLEFPSIAVAEAQFAKIGDHFLTVIDTARVDVHGDSADMSAPATQFDDVQHARKIEGKWKFAISAELVKSKCPPIPNAIELTTQAAVKEAALDDRIAADLKAGNLTNVAQVIQAKAAGKAQIYPPPPATQPQRSGAASAYRRHG